MKATLLFLLSVLRMDRTSARTAAPVTVSPNLSQFFEYMNVSIGCDQLGSPDWTVWRYTKSPESILSSCGSGWGQKTSSGCNINTTKVSDSGVYWCESKHRVSSRAVNITVTVLVILQGPVHPVMEGDDVTLNCSSKGSRTAADFYRGNSLIRTEPTGLMTIQNVSKAHEGAYKCRINDMKDSEPSWLLMEDGSGPVSLSVSPDSSHTFEYENLTLSCGKDSRSRGWRVIRASYPKLKLSTCGNGWGYPTGSGCFFNTTKKSDSAIYWCESPRKQRSNSVDITVHGPEKDVVLQSPVLPVTVGDNVTLSCRTRTSTKHHAEFYNGENHVGTGPAGHMTIPSVSLSAEGQYWCKVKDHKKSPPSWLFVRDPNLQLQSTPPLPAVIPKLVVVILFLICTVLAVRSWKSQHYRLGPPGRTRPVMIPLSPPLEDPPGLDDPYDDVMADITTEHHF